MLYLIGLGLWNEQDIPLSGIDAAKSCDSVYVEFYTNKWTGDMNKLQELVGNKIIKLKRTDVESEKITDEAKEKNVALLIPGDPLAATTHVQLMIDAKEKGVEVKVVHASSVYTAIAETGLQLYKFGRATTLVFFDERFHPASPLEAVVENRKAGLHTLILLDIKEDNRFMTVRDAIEILSLSLEKNTKIVACCQLGSPYQKIRYGVMADLAEDESLNGTPAAIIIPGKLHFKEEEALRLYE